MPTTSNFGWTTPADTDLVKDGAAAIRTLGNGIDSSFLDLKGGTTGQVLSKASNTDLDFSWVAQDDSNAIQNAIVDAKGDLISATAADTPARLAVGANGTVLTADSAEATGLKWASPAGGGANWSLVNTGGTALTGAAAITVSGISGADQIMVLVSGGSTANVNSFVYYTFNGDTGSNYYPAGSRILADSSYAANNFRNKTGAAATEITFSRMPDNAGATIGSGLIMSGCNSSGVKVFNVVGASYSSTNNANAEVYVLNGIYTGTSTISSITVTSDSGNWDAGTIYVYKTA